MADVQGYTTAADFKTATAPGTHDAVSVHQHEFKEFLLRAKQT